MLREAVYHKMYSDYAYAISREEVIFKLRTKKDDVEFVNFRYIDKYKYHIAKEVHSTVMTKVATDKLYDYYEVIVKHNFISINYFFELHKNNEILYYSNYDFSVIQPSDYLEFFNFPVMAEKDIFQVPEWAKNAIVYQIFVDRFANGNPSLNPQNTSDWYSEISRDTMLGGDLQGIIDKLDYIADLGINTIYLTPIFLAGSNHKYNTFDYMQIDPQFGTLDTLKELVKKAHDRDIKIILDAVFNHSGLEFKPFIDVVEKGEKSEYKDWFDIRKFPVDIKDDPDYGTFAYNGYMPKFMTQNEALKNYLLEVGVYWIKEADIDGWRLDVADEVGCDFWRDFRRAVKAAKPDALITGEIWYEAGPWLQGDQMDSVMNYVFTSAVKDFIVTNKIDAAEFGQRLESIRAMYKVPAYDVLWNLIGSHDTPRILHLLGEDVEKLKLVAFAQLTFTGIPMIYYGDELGMTGAADPDCRRGMLWDENKQNKELLAFYKKLISLRKENKALTAGKYTATYASSKSGVFGFKRQYKDEVIVGYINSGSSAVPMTLQAVSNATDLLKKTKLEVINGQITFEIPAKSQILIKL